MKLFSAATVYRLPSGRDVVVRGMHAGRVQCSYCDERGAGDIDFNPEWLYRHGVVMAGA